MIRMIMIVMILDSNEKAPKCLEQSNCVYIYSMLMNKKQRICTPIRADPTGQEGEGGGGREGGEDDIFFS